jgi:hypothetical protein
VKVDGHPIILQAQISLVTVLLLESDLESDSIPFLTDLEA